MKKLLTRTISGIVYICIVVISIYAGRLTENDYGDSFTASIAGNIVFSAIFLAIGLIGTHEIINNLAKKGIACNRIMAYIVGVLTYIIANVSWTSFYYLPIFSAHYPMLLAALWLSIFIIQLWREDESPFTTACYTLLPSIWIMLPFALMSNLQYSQPGFLMMLFIFIWVNDTFAYLSGMLFGKHKLWERHSPNKTWEGSIGGVLFSILAALFIAPLFNISYSNFGRVNWVTIALICSIVGTLGDLVESMFKRYCGVKDSGNIMPGHGGILDRFDSMLMAVPFAQAYLVLIFS